MMSVRKIILFLLLPAFSDAQINTIDSLKRLLQIEKQDTSRVLLLLQLSRAYLFSRPDTALVLGQQGLLLARETGFTKVEVRCLNRIASIFRLTGNYPKALQLDLEALKKAEAIQDKTTIAIVLRSIGSDYIYLGDYRQGINYARKALAISKTLNDQQGVASSLGNIGWCYAELNMLDSARIYTNQAYDLSVQLKNENITMEGLTNLGYIYSKMGQDAVAMSNYNLSIPYYIKVEDDAGLCEIYLGKAKLFRKAGNTDSCLHYAKLSLAIAQKAGFTNHVMYASNFLTDYYTSIHNVDSAFVYQSATVTAKDSLFSQEKAREIQSIIYDETMRQQQIQDAKEEAQTQLKFKVLFGGLFTFFVIAFLLYRNNRHKQKANFLLKQQKEKVESTLQELKLTQAQLVQSEKMASLGELTAGIAHEIQNPLNFVNNFSEVSNELLDEMKTELATGNQEHAIEIADDVKQNLEKTLHHGKRADAIVKGMLQHSRSSSGQKEMTDINALADEYLRLAYHGLRAKDKSFNAKFETDFDNSIGKINIIPQDIGRVLLNLFTNAFYSVTEKQKRHPENYSPVVSVSTKKINNNIQVSVKDNGMGIPKKVMEKIFQPFFTTKPTGEGTGLGLSLSYDIIVKGHGGELKAETKEGEFAEFIIQLPVQ
jgi:two-component system NtrC family sensor kinase